MGQDESKQYICSLQPREVVRRTTLRVSSFENTSKLVKLEDNESDKSQGVKHAISRSVSQFSLAVSAIREEELTKVR